MGTKASVETTSIHSYFTASEIRKRNPQVNWLPQQIGWLGRLKLVRAVKKENFTLFYESDVITLFEIRSKIVA